LKAYELKTNRGMPDYLSQLFGEGWWSEKKSNVLTCTQQKY